MLLYKNKGKLAKASKTRILHIDRRFLLGSQFPYVHDQPLDVVLVVNKLHIQHCSLDPGFILSKKTVRKPFMRHIFTSFTVKPRATGQDTLSPCLIISCMKTKTMYDLTAI